VGEGGEVEGTDMQGEDRRGGGVEVGGRRCEGVEGWRRGRGGAEDSKFTLLDPCGGEGWLTGRYRKMYRQYLIPAGKKIPLVITEHGIDCGVCGVTGCQCNGGMTRERAMME
jgi:hypothetical protein